MDRDRLYQEIAELSPEQRELFALLLQQEGVQLDEAHGPQREPEDVQPLSFAQRQLWFLDQLRPGSAAYNVACGVRFTGRLDIPALEASLEFLVARHSALRTTFAVRQDEPVQIVRPHGRLCLPILDLVGLADDEQERLCKRVLEAEATRPFDLEQGPLFRASLVELSDTEHLLVLCVHHIVFDAWSMGVLLQELGTAYLAKSAGQPVPLAPVKRQLVDFAQRQRERLSGERLARLRAYWKERLSGDLPLAKLPADHARPPEQSFRGGLHGFALSPALAESVQALCRKYDTSPFMTLLAAFKVLLHRYSGHDDILVGSPLANRSSADFESTIGFLVNPVVFRTDLSGDPTFAQVLTQVRSVAIHAYEHSELPFELLVEELRPERDLSYNPIFQISFALVSTPRIALPISDLTVEPFTIHTKTSKFDLTFDVWETPAGFRCTFEYSTDLFEPSTLERMAGHFQTLLTAVVEAPERPISTLPILTQVEREQAIVEWNRTQVAYPREECLHDVIAEQTTRRPDALALTFEGSSLTYAELDKAASHVAQALRERGIRANDAVGLYVERSLELVVGMLGILKAGGAYVPLDPAYPEDRLAFVLADCEARVVVTQAHLAPLVSRLGQAHGAGPSTVCVDLGQARAHTPVLEPRAMHSDSLAYIMYTSGSTGKPKGVMVSHRNVLNFFAGMDRILGHEQPGVWLAVTSFAFDISVLELLWTLSRGFHVVIQSEKHLVASNRSRRSGRARNMDFSLMYFASADRAGEQDKYRLLLEGARFADEHGFAAVWTPERHFHSFGGLYPDPAVTGAVIAAITKRVHIRAGSVVLPLHDPIRVAEAWSVIDNVSGGRVGIGFASGWHADDFVFAPDLYARRKTVMRERIDIVRSLWRGETLTTRGGAGQPVHVKIYPTPVQRELPIWLTAAGSEETFILAGVLGAGVLTHLLGQSPKELRDKIALYRKTWREHGHAGEGRVSLMLHTFVDDDLDALRDKVREPFCDYLRTSAGLMRNLVRTMDVDFDVDQVSEADIDALIKRAFDRFTGKWGLFGTVASCVDRIEELADYGVDELACLIDFGLETETVLQGLQRLAEVQQVCRSRADRMADDEDHGLAAQIRRHGVTHLQCTPSLARLLVEDPDSAAAVRGLDKLLVGGEALPVALARELRTLVQGEVINMYGPTETTIWSTSYQLTARGDEVLIGRPMANTQVYVVDRHQQLVPVGVPGELLIGGEGVTAGYLNRVELTREKFIPDPFGNGTHGRLYRTGDLVRYRPDGALEFLGRIDHQVKIRGHRIELGEVETVLAEHAAVKEAVVLARDSGDADKKLVAYLVTDEAYEPGQALGTIESAESQHVEQWQRVWDETYQHVDSGSEPMFNITGWRSSYTGEPIPAHEMREWVETTVARIRELQPRRVLEVGCGTGLLLFRLAPHCEHYTGVDVSAESIEYVRAHMPEALASKITLANQQADTLQDLDGGPFDVIVINSVVQYFPSASYLMRVLAQCTALVAPGGAIFLGDIRNHALLEAMHTSIELHHAADDAAFDGLQRRIAERIAREEELVLAPAFFTSLPAALPRISHVDVQIKPGKAVNEVTSFRYDVTLHIERSTGPVPAIRWIDWRDLHGGVQGIRHLLDSERPMRLGVRRIPSLRLAPVIQAMQLLQRDHGTVGALRTMLTSNAQRPGVDPDALWRLADELAYCADITWSADGKDGCYDAIFTHADCRMDKAARAVAGGTGETAQTLEQSDLYNRPLRRALGRELIAELRAHIQQRVPEFMVPSAFVVLERLPLTPNGKVDRKALLALQDEGQRDIGADFVAPRNPVEQRLTAAWADVLGIDRISVQDNFFDLGGHSLAATQLVFRLRRDFGLALPLNLLFDAPTVELLARAIESEQAAVLRGTGNTAKPHAS